MDAFNILLPLLFSFLITYVSIPAIIRVAQEKKLYDSPDNYRKKHKLHTPTLGGLAIFSGMIIGFLLFMPLQDVPRAHSILAALFILIFASLKDDIIPLAAYKKFLVQLSSTFIVVVQGDIRLTSFHGVFSIGGLPYQVSILLSIFTILLFINAFNMADGVNGLAAGLGLMVVGILSYFFWHASQHFWSFWNISLAGALLGFLRFNFQKRALIFMGDTGSSLIGFVSAVSSIKFIELYSGNNYFNDTAFAPFLAFVIVAIPLLDTLRVFLHRIVIGRSPFSADYNHIHHFLLETGLSNLQTAMLLILLNIMCVIFALAIKPKPEIGLIALFVVYIVCSFWLYRTRYLSNKRKLHPF